MKRHRTIIGLLTLSMFCAVRVSAQERYFTKTGRVNFDASGNMEKVVAVNKTVTAVFDKGTGALQFAVQMKGFEFPKALMQEHFNENYVESSKYPKAEFKGSIAQPSQIDLAKDGSYAVNVTGKMMLHGVTKDVSAPGNIVVKNGKPSLQSDFTITLKDYNISIPSLVSDKISPTAKVSVNCALEPLR
jgi:polyisoprenoid-binding protein YceI